MTYVVLLSVILLIALFSTYTVIEKNRKKAEALKKHLFNERVKIVTDNYKKQLSYFSEAKLLRPKHVPAMQAIASNFFVVQAHNDSNLILMEACLDNLSSVLASEMAKAHVTGNKDELAERVLHFATELPSGRGFNKIFYEEQLPALVFTLKSPDILPSPEEDLQDPEPSEVHNDDKEAIH